MAKAFAEAELYSARGLVKSWKLGDGVVTALGSVDLDIQAGEYLVIRGRSGSGKSTLLHVLAGLERPDRGQLLYGGRDLAQSSDRSITHIRRECFGFVFQDFNLIPTLTAAENVESALAPMQRSSSVRRRTVDQLLEDVGLADRAAHLPSQLSGGEQQRVAIARAIANTPAVLFADEPTGNLDTSSAAVVLDVLHSFSANRTMSLVVVTHDAAVAKDADRILTMSDGQLSVASS